MASSFTPNYNLEKPANGDDVNTWDVPVNGNSNLLDQILGTVTTISLTNANVNLTLSQQQNATIKLTGSISANIVIYFLAGRSGKWIVRNATTGNYTVTLQNANIGATVVAAQGASTSIYCDGTDVVNAMNASSGDFAISGGNLILDNTYGVNIKDNGGTARAAFYLTSGNILRIGNASYNSVSILNDATTSGALTVGTSLSVGTTSTLTGKVTTSNGISLSGTETIWFKDGGGTDRFMIGSDGAGTITIGNAVGGIVNTIDFQTTWGDLGGFTANGNWLSYAGTEPTGAHWCALFRGYGARSGLSGPDNGYVYNISWDGASANLYINTTSVGTIQLVSDRRIKDEISSVKDSAVDVIRKLRVVNYKIKDAGVFKADGRTRIGFVADELQAAIPSAVNGSPDAVDENGDIQPQTVNPVDILGWVTKAVQDIFDRLDAIEAKA